MHLMPSDTEKLLLAVAGMVARDRLARGVRLNHPESVALLANWVIERAREGATVADLMERGRTVLSADQVMDGVPAMIHDVQVEATFPDGRKLVTLHDHAQRLVGAAQQAPRARDIPGAQVLADAGALDVLAADPVNGHHPHFRRDRTQVGGTSGAAPPEMKVLPDHDGARAQQAQVVLDDRQHAGAQHLHGHCGAVVQPGAVYLGNGGRGDGIALELGKGIRDGHVQTAFDLGHGQVGREGGDAVLQAGQLIEITMDTAPMRTAMIDFTLRLLAVSAAFSVLTALLLNLATQRLIVGPIRRVIGHMTAYAASPDDSRTIITPAARMGEVRAAETALAAMQRTVTASLKQRERLAQLGQAVAKISHDLRNVLSTSQILADRLEGSADPGVRRTAPKLVGSISRAVNLCETTLAFGKAEEAPPQLSLFNLSTLVADVMKQAAAEAA